LRGKLSGQRQRLECPFSIVFIRREEDDIERHERRGCYEREKQRGERKQEGGTKKPQREEKDEEGKEKQVSWSYP